MAQLIDLRDLLKHEILDLYSAEEQIIEALPKMISKAANARLKTALSDHLKVTHKHRSRLNEIKSLLGDDQDQADSSEKKGFFSRLFGGSGGEKCKGTEGLIKEGEKMMGEEMSSEVMDAAIIGAAQKIEHYEICGYGTAAAYARELGLSNVAGLLQQTLDEEYQADDLLTALAVGKLNIDAEYATEASTKSKSTPAKKGTPSKKGSASKGSASKGTASKGSQKKAAPSNSNAKKAGSAGKSSKNAASSGNKSAGKNKAQSSGKKTTGSRSSGKSKPTKKR